LLTNLEQRGPANQAKRVVQACLTRDKLPLYERHIERFLTTFVARVKHGTPVLSTLRSELVYFCLDIMYGPADHPTYMRTLFIEMMDIQASMRRPLPGMSFPSIFHLLFFINLNSVFSISFSHAGQSDEQRMKKILSNVANRPCLATYIIQCFKDCVANNRQDTLAYWAAKLGMDAQGMHRVNEWDSVSVSLHFIFVFVLVLVLVFIFALDLEDFGFGIGIGLHFFFRFGLWISF
jgi:hypothetical protein